ncbi:MAG: TonB-dependent receptor [Pseudomonadota bacterium]
MQKLLLASISTTAWMLASTAGAQTTALDEAASSSDEQSEIITVYGTLNPIPVIEYPGQVSVITREDIDIFSPSTVADALRDVPGLEFSGGPRRTGETPAIRGRSGENVLILLDGARQSFISAHDGRFFIDPELLRSAEIVRGPASSLYGSGAVGGVLAFETVDADDLLSDGETYGARARVGYQSVNDEILGSFTAYTRQGPFDLIGNIGLRNSSDIDLGDGSELPSDDEIVTGFVKGGYQFNDALRLEASWQRFNNTAIEPNNGQGVAIGTDVEKDIQTDTYRVGAEFAPIGQDLINVVATAYRTETSVDEFDASLPRTTLRDIETTGANIRNASQFMLGAIETTFTVGADWYKDEQVGTDDNAMDGLRAGVPNGDAEFFGVFAQAEARIPLGDTLDLLVIPGIRYDDFNSSSSVDPEENNDSAWSPRLAASLGSDSVRVFGSYSEGFRAPSINELYLNGVHFPVPHPTLFNPQRGSFVFVNNNFIPNPDLTPETSETYEGGISLDFGNVLISGDRFSAKGSYYQSNVEDLIDLFVNFSFDPTCFGPPTFFPCSAGTTESRNLANAELSGFELESVYESRRLRMKATYSTVEGTDESDGSDIGTLTPNRFTLDTRFKIPEWDGFAGVRIQAAGGFERRELDQTTNALEVVESRESYTAFDLYGGWQPSFAKGIRFDFGVDNVFDTEFDRVFEGVSEPGRNYRAALTWQGNF